MMFCRSAGLSSKRLQFTMRRSFGTANTSIFSRSPAVRYTIGVSSIAAACSVAVYGASYIHNSPQIPDYAGGILLSMAIGFTCWGFIFAKSGYAAMTQKIGRDLNIAEFLQRMCFICKNFATFYDNYI